MRRATERSKSSGTEHKQLCEEAIRTICNIDDVLLGTLKSIEVKSILVQ